MKVVGMYGGSLFKHIHDYGGVWWSGGSGDRYA
jgi:hypothetical protein